jgi:hypothetical protein
VPQLIVKLRWIERKLPLKETLLLTPGLRIEGHKGHKAKKTDNETDLF